EHFPQGTFHMKNLRKNLLETGAMESLKAFALGGDLATLEQKIRQITSLMIHLPRRRFILIGDSGEKDPEVYRAIQRLFPAQVEKILIRDVLEARLAGMERIAGDEQPMFLDTSDLEAEITAMAGRASTTAPDSEKL
ncbi:MAG: App1 family protein, partial [Verrucomicrobiota bacterium]